MSPTAAGCGNWSAPRAAGTAAHCARLSRNYGAQLSLVTDPRLPHPLHYADAGGDAWLELLQRMGDAEELGLLQNTQADRELLPLRDSDLRTRLRSTCR